MTNLVLSDLAFGSLTLILTFAGAVTFLDYVDTSPQEETFTASYESSLTTRTLLFMDVEGKPLYEWIAAGTPDEDIVALIQSQVSTLTPPDEAWIVWLSDPYVIYNGRIIRQGASATIGQGEFTAEVDDVITTHRALPRMAIRTDTGVQPVLINHISPHQLDVALAGESGRLGRITTRGGR